MDTGRDAGKENVTRTECKGKRTSTKHVYTHRYSSQNIGAGKGKEKEHMRDVFCEGSLFPYQSSLNSGLVSVS